MPSRTASHSPQISDTAEHLFAFGSTCKNQKYYSKYPSYEGCGYGNVPVKVMHMLRQLNIVFWLQSYPTNLKGKGAIYVSM